MLGRETRTELDAERAIDGGPVEVVLTHETIDGGTSPVESILATNPMGWAPAAVAYSAGSRDRVRRGNVVRPFSLTVTSVGGERSNSRMADADLGREAQEILGSGRYAS